GDKEMSVGAEHASREQAADDEYPKSRRRQQTHLPGMLTRDEVVEYYAERTGRQEQVAKNGTFYRVYGIFRLAVILQQLYKRYVDGGTHNPIYANMWEYVVYADRQCRELIASDAKAAG